MGAELKMTTRCHSEGGHARPWESRHRELSLREAAGDVGVYSELSLQGAAGNVGVSLSGAQFAATKVILTSDVPSSSE